MWRASAVKERGLARQFLQLGSSMEFKSRAVADIRISKLHPALLLAKRRTHAASLSRNEAVAVMRRGGHRWGVRELCTRSVGERAVGPGVDARVQ